ncbi:MFS-type transporter SLC18B1-like isoform X2 [Lycorma delicatula]|uniref:MFS-type transporter SLC18B1-like isoform X2 n=1 Tax=Lycorma delicatula TaxID=130591 RepID=UPI003F519932
MSPATVLSDSESEAVMNDKSEHTGDNIPTRTTKHIGLNNKVPPLKTTESIPLCVKISTKTEESAHKMPTRTKMCDFNVASSSNLICKTYQGQVIESSSGKHLYCHTHSLFTNCVLNPCSSRPLPYRRERLLRSQKHPKPSVLKDFSKNQVFVLLSLAIGDFISSCSMSIMAPFFPKEATEKGMGVTLSGFVFSCYALVMFIMSPAVGKMLPKVGAKPIFIGGLLLAGFSNLLFGGLEAVGAGAFSTASFVFVVEVFPDNISTVLGILETFIGLGMSVGPAIGGILYSYGGFGLPFFILGTSMILVIPVNFWFLPAIKSKSKDSQEKSFWSVLKIPSIFIIGLMIVVSSNVWSFLDPTLEPHLRALKLTSKEVGLVFLLFSSIYGVFSLIWGWLADKVGNHWSMMVIGQLLSVVCLLALGPSPILTQTPNTLLETLVALSALGISVALTLMPTFQALLQCAVENGHKREIATYSIIAGAWSCMYSLGEVLGPTLGGVLLDKYGFPVCSTVMAAITLMVAVGSLVYFSLQSTYISEFNEERKPLMKKQDKHVYYADLAGDACVIFVPTARSPL